MVGSLAKPIEGRAFASRSLLAYFPTIQAHEDAIWAVSWTKKSNKIITGSLDDAVKVWNGADYTHTLTFDGHQLGVVSLDTNNLGTIAASSSLDSSIRIWDLPNNVILKTIEAGPVESFSVSLSPDSHSVCTGSHDGRVNIYGIESTKKERSFDTGKGKFVMGVAWSPDNSKIAASLEGGSIIVFDVATGKPLTTSQTSHAQTCRSLSFAPDGRTLYSGSDDTRVGIWDVGRMAGMAAKLDGHTGWVVAVDVGSDGTRLATGSTDKKVKVWDLVARQCLHTFDSHTDQVWGVSFNEEGSKLATVGDSRQIIVFETRG